MPYTEEDNDPTTLDLTPHLEFDTQELVQEARERVREGDLAGAELFLEIAGALP